MRTISPEALFFRALAVPPAAREAWVARVCADDPARGAELAALLEAHDAAGLLMDESPLELPRFEPGARVARYTLRRRLGEGGCGIVFAARHGDDTSPTPLVALKLIKPGFATPVTVAHLETEGRTLARLSHPGVPRLIASGQTEAGDAYLAMELVRGRRLTAYVDARRHPVSARLELFARFCDVLAHVHSRGIRHGDVKPANILVARSAGSPRGDIPVLIDFGLASIAPETGSAPASPASSSTAGTLPYLSPEQVHPTLPRADHRSDLYAAGVALHQLLTGRTPFIGKGLDELRRWFATTNVVPPSRVVATSDAAEQRRIARQRNTSAKGLIRTLHGAVDALVQRALARDPARRFQSAAEFAAAIRRLLRTSPRPEPASAAIAFPEPWENHSATPATFRGHSGLPRRETPAAAA